MVAMDRHTGKAITGLAEIEQAVDEVLDTIPGDRIMRADYGADVFSLVDQGMDQSGTARLAQTVADALRRHEPRIKISKVLTEGTAGELTQTIVGTVRTTNEQITVKR